ncbi:uncharacterized protein BDR25DRAFT_347771 [Lindgomyces ingoldianus]|uniref:Uncharacterized protein n=1 Tax=Lindgomyces ingoldianus TaxID=673940 RepID=A0ACB6RDR3_9PLEO|nr:uncharacterized protein BDR25DRAFT_347771 [Lindgomyces ingoldianus]KAF2477399.1 hypothetical protein BDR25DRAFT_347771 [Lindgomyces ingoldianus]
MLSANHRCAVAVSCCFISLLPRAALTNNNAMEIARHSAAVNDPAPSPTSRLSLQQTAPFSPALWASVLVKVCWRRAKNETYHRVRIWFQMYEKLALTTQRLLQLQSSCEPVSTFQLRFPVPKIRPPSRLRCAPRTLRVDVKPSENGSEPSRVMSFRKVPALLYEYYPASQHPTRTQPLYMLLSLQPHCRDQWLILSTSDLGYAGGHRITVRHEAEEVAGADVSEAMQKSLLNPIGLSDGTLTPPLPQSGLTVPKAFRFMLWRILMSQVHHPRDTRFPDLGGLISAQPKVAPFRLFTSLLNPARMQWISELYDSSPHDLKMLIPTRKRQFNVDFPFFLEIIVVRSYKYHIRTRTRRESRKNSLSVSNSVGFLYNKLQSAFFSLSFIFKLLIPAPILSLSTTLLKTINIPLQTLTPTSQQHSQFTLNKRSTNHTRILGPYCTELNASMITTSPQCAAHSVFTASSYDISTLLELFATKCKIITIAIAIALHRTHPFSSNRKLPHQILPQPRPTNHDPIQLTAHYIQPLLALGMVVAVGFRIQES